MIPLGPCEKQIHENSRGPQALCSLPTHRKDRQRSKEQELKSFLGSNFKTKQGRSAKTIDS